MKISYKWLAEYIDIDLTVEALAEKITNAGIEVEEIITKGENFNNIILARVESVDKHPDADKLSVCTVTDGLEVYQVICGAPNVKSGQIVPFAKIGCKFSNGIKIKKAKIRGIESNGMICSKEELGLEEKSDGIWPIETQLPLGSDINELLLDLKDYILDLFVTSNRPDCLSHIGIAREIAAFTDKTIKLPAFNVKESISSKIDDLVKIEIAYPEGCPRYAARIINNVKISPSPDWLKNKLEAIGMRSINNVVDVTNFVLNELGQPLHSFDYDCIKDHQIIVRKSKAGEKFITLDEKERVLPADTILICDAEKPIAIGGIMGGVNSEVSEQTTSILLESAYFNPQNILQSSRKLGLVTDASMRFEKGIDYENTLFALDRASQLIQDVAGGEIIKGTIDKYPTKIEQKIIPFRPEQVNRILGTHLQEEEIYQVLEKLDLKKIPKGIPVPSYRMDLTKEIDIIEEVARIINLEAIPTSYFEPLFLDRLTNKDEILLSVLRTNLLMCGLNEAFTNSMLPVKQAEAVSDDSILKILNPISDELACLRPSLLAGLLLTIKHNKNRNNHDLKFFEIGRVFSDLIDGNIGDQPIKFACAITGARHSEFWESETEKVDFFDTKGLVEQIMESLNIKGYTFSTAGAADGIIFDSGFSMGIVLNNKNVGTFGKVYKNILNLFDIKSEVFFAELNFELIKNNISLNKKYKSIGKYPYIEKDLALLMDKITPSIDVVNFIKEQAGGLLRSVTIFDVYENKEEISARKSIAFRLKFQSDDKTLKDEEVDAIFRSVIAKCETQFNAKLREG